MPPATKQQENAMNKTELDRRPRLCAEDDCLLKEEPPMLSPDKQRQHWAKVTNSAVNRTTENVVAGVQGVIGTGSWLNYLSIEGARTGLIPRGQLGQWLQKNVPQVPARTLYRWRDLAARTVEAMQLVANQ